MVISSTCSTTRISLSVRTDEGEHNVWNPVLGLLSSPDWPVHRRHPHRRRVGKNSFVSPFLRWIFLAIKVLSLRARAQELGR